MSAWTVSAAAPVVGARHLAAKGRVAPTRVATSAGRVAPAPTRGATLRVSAEGERRNPESIRIPLRPRARSILPTPDAVDAARAEQPEPRRGDLARKQTVTNESARVSLVPIFPDRVASRRRPRPSPPSRRRPLTRPLPFPAACSIFQPPRRTSR